MFDLCACATFGRTLNVRRSNIRVHSRVHLLYISDASDGISVNQNIQMVPVYLSISRIKYELVDRL